MKKWLILLLFLPTLVWGTVSVETTRIDYSGDGATVSFNYPFMILEDDDLTVIVTDSSGSEVTLVLNTDYTVSGAGDASGSITLTTGTLAASGETLTLLRNVELTQETDYVDGEVFSAESMETALDKLVLVNQQIKEQGNRALRFPKGANIDGELPGSTASSRANKLIGFDDSGDITLRTDIGSTSIASTPAAGSIPYWDNTILRVDTLAALKTFVGFEDDLPVYMAARSTLGDGGAGVFLWDSSDLSTEVTADTQSGIYVAPDSDATGASGAWVRQYDGISVFAAWFGTNSTAVQGAADNTPEFGSLVFTQNCTLTTTVNIPRSMELRGVGEAWDKPTISTATADLVMFTRADGARIRVFNLNFQGDGSENGVGATTIGFKLLNSTTQADIDSEFSHCRFYRMKYPIRGYGRSVTLHRTHFSSCRYGYVGSPASGDTSEAVRGFHFVDLRFHSIGSNSVDASVLYRPTFTTAEVSTANDTITFTGHSFVNDDIVIARESGGLPAGLTDGDVYFVGVEDVDTIKLYLYDSTVSGRAAVDLTSVGTGTNSIDRTSTCIMFTYASNMQGGQITGVVSDFVKRGYYGKLNHWQISGWQTYRAYETAIESPDESTSADYQISDVLWTNDDTGTAAEVDRPAFIVRSDNGQIQNNSAQGAGREAFVVAGDNVTITNNRSRQHDASGTTVIPAFYITGDNAALKGNRANSVPASHKAYQITGANAQVDDNYASGTFTAQPAFDIDGANPVFGPGNDMSAGTNFIDIAGGVTVYGTPHSKKSLLPLNAFSFSNSWVAYSGTTPGYRKINNIVHLHGRISTGTASDATTMFTLPAGYRPTETTWVDTICDNSGTKDPCQLLIGTDGTVKIYNAAGNTFVVLENVTFRAI